MTLEGKIQKQAVIDIAIEAIFSKDFERQVKETPTNEREILLIFEIETEENDS